ncbi:hypothetical protein B0H15DRAFT_958458 [Mycena belliarum]|uniref:Uncharacterized protein n=1 Tax=Mycena belliarum TaxID=1033014 RepID=A0AAD6TLQ2_9AGAR|nr:hypothetical protein B0H15DRAFT_958458 [Mycena belliae]
MPPARSCRKSRNASASRVSRGRHQGPICVRSTPPARSTSPPMRPFADSPHASPRERRPLPVPKAPQCPIVPVDALSNSAPLALPGRSPLARVPRARHSCCRPRPHPRRVRTSSRFSIAIHPVAARVRARKPGTRPFRPRAAPIALSLRIHKPRRHCALISACTRPRPAPSPSPAPEHDAVVPATPLHCDDSRLPPLGKRAPAHPAIGRCSPPQRCKAQLRGPRLIRAASAQTFGRGQTSSIASASTLPSDAALSASAPPSSLFSSAALFAAAPFYVPRTCDELLAFASASPSPVRPPPLSRLRPSRSPRAIPPCPHLPRTRRETSSLRPYLCSPSPHRSASRRASAFAPRHAPRVLCARAAYALPASPWLNPPTVPSCLPRACAARADSPAHPRLDVLARLGHCERRSHVTAHSSTPRSTSLSRDCDRRSDVRACSSTPTSSAPLAILSVYGRHQCGLPRRRRISPLLYAAIDLASSLSLPPLRDVRGPPRTQRREALATVSAGSASAGSHRRSVPSAPHRQRRTPTPASLAVLICTPNAGSAKKSLRLPMLAIHAVVLQPLSLQAKSSLAEHKNYALLSISLSAPPLPSALSATRPVEHPAAEEDATRLYPPTRVVLRIVHSATLRGWFPSPGEAPRPLASMRVSAPVRRTVTSLRCSAPAPCARLHHAPPPRAARADSTANPRLDVTTNGMLRPRRSPSQSSARPWCAQYTDETPSSCPFALTGFPGKRPPTRLGVAPARHSDMPRGGYTICELRAGSSTHCTSRANSKNSGFGVGLCAGRQNRASSQSRAVLLLGSPTAVLREGRGTRCGSSALWAPKSRPESETRKAALLFSPSCGPPLRAAKCGVLRRVQDSAVIGTQVGH